MASISLVLNLKCVLLDFFESIRINGETWIGVNFKAAAYLVELICSAVQQSSLENFIAGREVSECESPADLAALRAKVGGVLPGPALQPVWFRYEWKKGEGENDASFDETVNYVFF